MRHTRLLFAGAFLIPAAAGFSQESICNPCVDLPSHFYQDHITGPNDPNGSNVIGAEGVRSLTLITAADMIRELQGRLAASNCPVTLAANGPAFSFDGDSDGWSGPLWFGSRAFAVNLRLDATYTGGDKFFWYSTGFRPEQASELQVSIRRLDAGPLSASALEPTNALFDGRWHMLTGISFPEPGCWEITGSYRNQQLTFVVESVEP